MAKRRQEGIPLKALVFADGCGSTDSVQFDAAHSFLSKPVLAWQLSTLARYGVKEAIVLSSVPLHIPYFDRLERMKIIAHHSSSWTGEGEALRYVDKRDDLRPQDDFLLVRQGSIFNIDVSKLVAEHKARRAVDKNWLITAVFRRGAAASSSGLILGIESKSGTIVKYEDRCSRSVSIDVRGERTRLSEGGQVEICADVLDIGLDVCTPDFLVEYRENFYFDEVRSIIQEKLESGDAEILGNRFHARFIKSSAGEFGARINSLAALAQTSIDALNGWMYPVSLAGVSASEDVYKCLGDVSVVVASASCPSVASINDLRLRKWNAETAVLGKGVIVGPGTRVARSVIGNNVVIGAGAFITDSIVSENSCIEDGCVIENSIVSSNCTVKQGSQIPKCCYLDKDVVIGAKFEGLLPYSLVSRLPDNAFIPDLHDDDDELVTGTRLNDLQIQEPHAAPALASNTNGIQQHWNAAEVGEGGVGRIVRAEFPKADPFFSAGGRRESFIAVESDEEDILEESVPIPEPVYLETHPATSGPGQEFPPHLETETFSNYATTSRLPQALDNRTIEFHRELLETVEKSRIERVDMSNTAFEIRHLKLNYQCSLEECLAGLSYAIAADARNVCRRSADANILHRVKAVVKEYNQLLVDFARNSNTQKALSVVSTLALCFCNDGILLQYLLHTLYEEGILEEDGILAWATLEGEAVRKNPQRLSPFSSVKPFIDWLMEASSEDE